MLTEIWDVKMLRCNVRRFEMPVDVETQLSDEMLTKIWDDIVVAKMLRC